MSNVTSNSELTTKEIVEQAISDLYRDYIFPYLAKGNNGYSETPIGAMQMFDDDTAPSGWLIADGTVYNIDDYPFLASHFERVHGSKNYYGGDGTTTFAVPNWQGEFFRASGTNSHANQGDGAAVGVHQDGTQHTFLRNQDTGLMIYSSYGNQETPNNLDTKVITNGKVRGGSKTGGDVSTGDPLYYTSRPTNTSLLCCIKAVPAGINYSTEEQEIGTWVDGKRLYSKTIENISITTVDVDDMDIGLDANAQVQYYKGFVRVASSEYVTQRLPLFFVHPSGLLYSFSYYILKNKLTARRGSSVPNHLVTITAYYTKTTD